MCDKPASFHRENKSFGNPVAPAFDHFQRWQPIKRGVDFDRRELRRVKKEMHLRGKSIGLK
jgi:hypothetical protein